MKGGIAAFFQPVAAEMPSTPKMAEKTATGSLAGAALTPPQSAQRGDASTGGSSRASDRENTPDNRQDSPAQAASSGKRRRAAAADGDDSDHGHEAAGAASAQASPLRPLVELSSPAHDTVQTPHKRLRDLPSAWLPSTPDAHVGSSLVVDLTTSPAGAPSTPLPAGARSVPVAELSPMTSLAATPLPAPAPTQAAAPSGEPKRRRQPKAAKAAAPVAADEGAPATLAALDSRRRATARPLPRGPQCELAITKAGLQLREAALELVWHPATIRGRRGGGHDSLNWPSSWANDGYRRGSPCWGRTDCQRWPASTPTRRCPWRPWRHCHPSSTRSSPCSSRIGAQRRCEAR